MESIDEIRSRKRGALVKGETAGGGTRGIHVHGGPTFYYGGVYFSLLQMIDSAHTGLMPTELAISRDGVAIERPFRDVWFIPADGGDNFTTFGTITAPRLDGGNDLLALVNYLGTFSPVAPPSTDRVNELP